MFYDVYMKLCEEHGEKPYALVLELGASNNSIVANWKNKGTKPRVEFMQKIADHFGVSIAYLLEESMKSKKAPSKEEEAEKSPTLQPESEVDKEMFALWKSASEEERRLVLRVLRASREEGEKNGHS